MLFGHMTRTRNSNGKGNTSNVLEKFRDSCHAYTVHQGLFSHLRSQVYSSEVKKTEVLMENFRRAIGIKIKEVKEVFEGQVVSLVSRQCYLVVGLSILFAAVGNCAKGTEASQSIVLADG